MRYHRRQQKPMQTIGTKGGKMKDVASKHQFKIATSTIKMSKEGASIAGGMSHKEAVKVLRGYFSDGIIRKLLQEAGHSEEDIDGFMV